MKKETQCVHAGTRIDQTTGGVNSPIYPSTAFDTLHREEVVYPRYFNTPNQQVIVQKLCALEGAEDGVLFSSGMSAISSAILSCVKAGDHVVMLDSIYGGTHAFATDMLEQLGIDYSFCGTSPTAIAEAIHDRTKVVVIESPTNPLIEILDITEVAHVARARGVTTIMDNTFASPVNQTPLAMGVDIVVHSGTKYLGGHSDLCCGAALTNRRTADAIRAIGKNLGGSLNALDCYLLERSLKTLALRVRQQNENALRVAEFLAQHSSISRVLYPGQPGFEGHEIAKRQMAGFGGMLSFELNSDIEPISFLHALEMIQPAVSLGGIETLITIPAKTSHARLSEEARQRLGITHRLLRLSVGIENAQDIIEDLQQALNRA